ncbi:peptidase M15 [Bacillus sp. FJAT-27231]|uniref:M15 family metallopeptidase n=1 Tax=Bacillus sp. FJAT-27231 TaxID=1679168 RepID=UPI0006712F1D|nr:M15 family metallopeptidase [Bacillus sp. FJAT-27231]KMY54534.1 peptidase M15 [Bacillus sp. FJAT-27231]
MKKTGWLLTAALLLSGCQQLDGKEKQESHQEKSVSEKQPPAKEASAGPKLEAVYFNKIKEVNGKKVITNPENIMVLVNKQFSLPGDYTPPDLVRPKVAFSFGEQDIEKSHMRKEAAEALEKMFAGAKQEQVQLFAVSGYRSYKRQVEIMNNQIASAGSFEKAAQAVAPPGQSEHQTGLTMDISAESVNFDLLQSFETTKEGQWLANNAHKYGFILRYPKGKEKVTEYMYEPWHFRYVGVKAAEEIFRHGWTLEEYFNNVEKI